MLGCGLINFSGILNKKLTFTATLIAILSHLGLGLGRWMSIAQDGKPANTHLKHQF